MRAKPWTCFCYTHTHIYIHNFFHLFCGDIVNLRVVVMTEVYACRFCGLTVATNLVLYRKLVHNMYRRKW